MQKWMVFFRCSDGIHFLYNGEGCIPVSPDNNDGLRWHHDYGELPQSEILILEDTLNRPRKHVFEIKGYGIYQVIARGEFKEL